METMLKKCDVIEFKVTITQQDKVAKFEIDSWIGTTEDASDKTKA